ncbi:MAG: ribonuclease T [Gammaproteobacteria bacterium]|nr:ribonuclease T [Gammaproteobacteria bacterium]
MKIKVIARLILIITLFFSASNIVLASMPATGSITATQSCEAYVSKNKLTNPDHTKLVVNKKYSIFEANKASNPDWFRIRIDNANPPERWVARYCGTVDVQTGGGGGDGGGGGGASNACRTPGLEDSYVLALSWQPAFCETHRGKPECRIDDRKSYQARNFTLHGLWPNKASCGANYGYCGEVQDKPAEFCDYPMLSLFTETRSNLGQVMPSAAAGSCLQRHEWFKHGACQTRWSIDEYYEVAIDLTRQFNESGIAYFISRNTGNTVTEAAFIKKVDCAHGDGAHKRIELKCQGGNLVDVYVSLPNTVNEGAGLGELMQQGQGEFKSNCGGQFKVDPIGFLQ